MRILVVDTETTGLPKSRNGSIFDQDNWPYIVQFSYLIYNSDTYAVEKMVDYIIKIPDEIDIPEVCVNIHGISNAISKEQGVVIDGVLCEFIMDMESCDLIVAHNMEFDMNIIMVEMVRLKQTIPLDSPVYAILCQQIEQRKGKSSKLYCTMQESIDLCNILVPGKFGKPYKKFPTLAELHTRLFGYVPQKLHNALNDVVICFRCFYKMKFDRDIGDENNRLAEMIELLK